MVKNHLKRIAMPTTWTTKEKKTFTWVARAKPGMHSFEEGMPLVLVLREMLNHANSAREVKYILSNKQVLIDGIRRRDHKFTVGFMDSISIPELNENYRISLNENGKLSLIKIDKKESAEKLVKIRGKGLYKGKTQLRLSDGRTMLIEKSKEEYKTSDSLLISVPEQKIMSHLKFEKGALVLLTDGKKIGNIGVIEEIKKDNVKIKAKNIEFETLKKYCFVIGKQKPALTIN